jgi:hypothetical protein
LSPVTILSEPSHCHDGGRSGSDCSRLPRPSMWLQPSFGHPMDLQTAWKRSHPRINGQSMPILTRHIFVTSHDIGRALPLSRWRSVRIGLFPFASPLMAVVAVLWAPDGPTDGVEAFPPKVKWPIDAHPDETNICHQTRYWASPPIVTMAVGPDRTVPVCPAPHGCCSRSLSTRCTYRRRGSVPTQG